MKWPWDVFWGQLGLRVYSLHWSLNTREGALNQSSHSLLHLSRNDFNNRVMFNFYSHWHKFKCMQLRWIFNNPSSCHHITVCVAVSVHIWKIFTDVAKQKSSKHLNAFTRISGSYFLNITVSCDYIVTTRDVGYNHFQVIATNSTIFCSLVSFELWNLFFSLHALNTHRKNGGWVQWQQKAQFKWAETLNEQKTQV